MKKLFFGLVAVLGMALMFTACHKNVTPEFKFQLEVKGLVNDSATKITSDFAGNVTNEVESLVVNEAEVLTLDAPEAKKANEWVESYVSDIVTKNYSSNAKYSIHIKGYVKETLTGLVFSIDKTFTNLPETTEEVATEEVIEDTADTVAAISEDTVVVDSLK